MPCKSKACKAFFITGKAFQAPGFSFGFCGADNEISPRVAEQVECVMPVAVIDEVSSLFALQYLRK